jgi:hypothetical protein
MAVPSWAFDDREFWNHKDPSEWTASEVKEILTQSPWAKAASVYNNTGASGPLGSSRSGGGGRHGGGGGGVASTNPGAPGGPNNWKTTIRWESALPVREARKVIVTPDEAENYVIALIGSIPSVGIPSDEDDPAERKAKLDTLRDSTRLERRDEPLDLVRAVSAQGGTLFYFSRVFAIKPEDRQVTFVTKMGPLEIKCKFSLREMIVHGNLEL